MLFPLLISLLVVATVTLFGIGAVLIHQQRTEQVGRRPVSGSDAAMVKLGDITTVISEIDDHALAKLQLELQARRHMAEMIG